MLPIVDENPPIEKILDIPAETPVCSSIEEDDTLDGVDSLPMESETDYARTRRSHAMISEFEPSSAGTECGR
uniref:Uncharacterized protein n=1 Tax=Steinernema glaseri TaxID=37863 RepID=A0A1I8A2C7_9BILA